MANIIKNDYGSVVVNDRVIIKLIIKELLDLGDAVALCNRKGKIIKDKHALFIEADYYDSVEYLDTIKANEVRIYMVKQQSVNISDFVDDLYQRINEIFDRLHVSRPRKINIFIKGEITDDGLVKKEIEVQHNNE